MLEYYDGELLFPQLKLKRLTLLVGILILTSNRVGTFDEAFKSRIQLALHYETLKEPQRRSIWENFIKRLDGFETHPTLSKTASFPTKGPPHRKESVTSRATFSSKIIIRDLGVDTADLTKHLDELAKQKINGREIRNAITTARQLAIYKKEKMAYVHLQHVIKVAGKFDKYLFELHENVDDNQMMREDGVR